VGPKVEHFALKIFKGSGGNAEARLAALVEKAFRRPPTEEKAYSDEVSANGHLKSHGRIVTLLHAFKHCGTFHLVFPWADGGNLLDLWRRTAQQPDKMFGWFWQECQGLADGLFSIHERGVLHGDIKPENILCFPKDPSRNDTGTGATNSPVAMYELRLADFGISTKGQGHDHKVERSWFAARQTKTQRPPEITLGTSSIGLEADIWSLGCVYLDFITWLLEGNESRQEFEEHRMKTGEISDADPGRNAVQEDTFFRVAKVGRPKPKAELKPSVSKVRSERRNPFEPISSPRTELRGLTESC
jgi:serine/threonine protein kinase